MNPANIKQSEFIDKAMKKNDFKKIIFTNNRLLSNKNFKLIFNEQVNVIFQRNMNK